MNDSSNTVSVIDTSTNKVVDTVPVGNGPFFSGICGNGNALLAAGNTFVARSGGALGCTGPSGAVFTGGTLQIAGADLSSAVPVTLGAAGGTVDTAGNDATLSGPISGPGALTKIDAGTLTLSGTNTYSGGTMLTGGTLAVTNSTIAGNGTITSSSIGTGALTFNGGTLQAAAGNLTFANAANINTVGGTIDTNGNSLTWTGVIADGNGSGALTKIGAGTLTLTGANTYSGGTTISAGTLQLGNGGATGAITGPVTNNANLAFNRSDTYTFDGIISGVGGNVQQNGTGTTILTAANTYTGATTVNAGTLEVDGTLASPNVTVNAGGTLSGTGTLADPTINAGGTLAPGSQANPYGTLTVGPTTFAAGSFYAVAITPTQNSRTDVVGTTTIQGGTVNVAAGAGIYAKRQYTILNATGGVTGTFAGVTSNLAFLMPTLAYDSDDVYLNITGNAGGNINYTTAAVTTNQWAVAYGLNAGEKATGGTGPILGAFNQLSVPQAQAAFDSISGEGIAAAQNTAFGSTSLFISSIFDQTTFYGSDGGSANQITLTEAVPGFTAYAPSDGGFTRTPIHELADLPSRVAPIPAPVFVPQRSWRAWATGFGGVEDFSGNAFPVGSAGQSDTIYGGTLGIDYQVMPNYLAGLAIGGSNGAFSVPGRATSGSTTGGHVAFYDLATFGAFYAASTTSASFYSNQTTRTIAGFGGFAGETDRGNFRSNAYSSKVEFGRHFAAYGGLVTPFASIELTDLRSYGFTETPLSGPGLFALNVQGQDTASVPSLVGARFQTVLPLGNGLVLSPSLQVAWEHQFSPQRPVLAGLINLPGAVFLTNGASPARDSAAVKAGGELAISKQAALFANFDGDFSGVDRFYGGKGGFKYVW